MSDQDKPFFVGYLDIPARLRWFLAISCIAIIGLFTGAGLLVGATQDTPEASGFRFDYGRQTVTGVVELVPYAILHVTEGNDRIKPGKTLMLSGQGKFGLDPRVMAMSGDLATVTGIILQRGTIDMLQLQGGRRGFSTAEGTAPKIESEPLGRWKITGEICDGKCFNGAMRPGRGLAHKACANLCLEGDIPPVLVSTQPVEGSEFMMITGPDGTILPRDAYDYVGQFVTLEGELERRGQLLVLRLDTDSIEVVKG